MSREDCLVEFEPQATVTQGEPADADESTHGTQTPSRPRLVQRIAISTIRGYQHLMAGRPSPCRFEPSCSQYAIDAVAERGAFSGCLLALRRILRCNPWGGSGWDPVPPRTSRNDRPVGRLKAK
jgi:putative membrane protein insertion efficiency factor